MFVCCSKTIKAARFGLLFYCFKVSCVRFFRTFRFSRFLHVSFFKSSTFRFAGLTRYHHNTYNHKQGKPTPYGMSIHFLTAVIVSLQSGDFRTFTSKKQTLLFLICLVKLLFHCQLFLLLLQNYDNSARNKHQISQFIKVTLYQHPRCGQNSCHKGMINISPCFIQI